MVRKKQGALAVSDSTDRCPVAFALDVWGDRWSFLILRDMFFKQKRYFKDFLGSPEGISTNILTNRLEMLMAAGIIEARVDANDPRRKVYFPTTMGKDLLPTMLSMIAWSAEYNPQPCVSDAIIVGAPRHLLRRWKNDGSGLVAEILKKLP